ncbi:MAG: hypothetical protein IJM51_01180 [Clostridia bacterium]|nr:hypothetical protein [Clostridia bacterium]
MKKNNRFRLRLAVNVFLLAGTLFAFYLMYFRNEGLLLAKGIAAFKYFTVLSNFFGGVMAAVWLVSAAVGRGKIPRAVTLLKFTAAVCLGLTFLTVMVFLGQLYGYIAMLRNANLWFHLLIPVAAMGEIIFFNDQKLSLKNCAGAMIPMLAYAFYYLLYNLIMGRDENPLRYDWYGFLLWGWGIGCCILAVICVATFLIGAVLLFFNNVVRKNK